MFLTKNENKAVEFRLEMPTTMVARLKQYIKPVDYILFCAHLLCYSHCFESLFYGFGAPQQTDIFR